MVTQNTVTTKQLDKLLQRDEGLRLEYKTESEKRRDIAECLAAMANSKGGFVIFGVEDPQKGKLPPKIIGIKNVKSVIDRVNCAATDCTPSLNAYVYVGPMEYLNKTIVVAEVNSKVPMITNVRGRFLKRRGSFNMVMGFEDFIHYAVSHKVLLFENMPVPRAKWQDLDPQKIKRYMKLRQRKSKREIDMYPREFLNSISCLVEKNGETVPNYAGLLLFGRDPQRFVLQGEMICIRFRGTEVSRGYIDRQDITGTIPEMIDQGVDFVRKNMRIGGYVWGVKRTDYEKYPLTAVREAITNCCAHREYCDNGFTCVYMFDDRIEFSSPGPVPLGISLEQIQRFEFRSRPRNHLITHILRDMGYMENAGSGLKMMATTMTENNLPKPKFREFESELRTYFYGPGEDFMKEVAEKEKEEAEMLSPPSDLSDRQIQALDYVRKHSRITNKVYRELFGVSNVTAKRELQDLTVRKILHMKGKGRGTFYVV